MILTFYEIKIFILHPSSFVGLGCVRGIFLYNCLKKESARNLDLNELASSLSAGMVDQALQLDLLLPLKRTRQRGLERWLSG